MPTTRRLLLAAGLAAPTFALAAKPEPLPVGALFPFSGSLSLLGDESFRGLDLACDEANAAGGLLGRPLALARGDAADQVQATAEAKRLIEQTKAAMIFGSFASTVALAGSAAAEVAGTPYFELDAVADAITERGFKLLFRTGPQARAIGALATDTLPDVLAPLWQAAPAALKLAVLHEDGPGGAAVAEAAAKRAQERGLVVAERVAYAANTLDMAPFVQRLRGMAADVVIHAGFPNDVVTFHRAMMQAGWRPRMMVGACGGYALNDTAQALGAEFEGVMSAGVTPYHVSDVVAPGAAEVAAAYQRKYGAPPRSGHSLVCFSGAHAMFQAIARADTLDRDRLRASVLATNLPAGSTVGGFGVAFDEQGQNRLATPVLAQWQKGALLAIGPKPAAVAEPLATMG